jgi:Uma2 family endonuclease
MEMAIRALGHVAPVEVGERQIEYPDSDGTPMGETGFHVTQILTTLATLRLRFRHRTDVYVGANMFLYYRQGDPRAVVAPDVFVVFDTTSEQRRSWKVWEENERVPSIIFEITSPSTRDADLLFKRALYEDLGVQEYVLFDPVGEYLEPVLQGYHLAQDRYVATPQQSLPDGGYELVSDVLGVILRAEAGELALYDRVTGEKLPAPLELYDLAEQEAAARQAAEARAERAEAELARLQTELARLRGEDAA